MKTQSDTQSTGSRVSAEEHGALFQASASSWDYAIQMASVILGRINGRGSDCTVHYANAGWCKLEWLDSHQEARAPGLPTINLPCRFCIVKANINEPEQL